MSRQSLRVLHCPAIIGGNPFGLARAEREVGLNSWSVSLEKSKYDYSIDEAWLSKKDPRLFGEFMRLKLLWKALHDYDVIHFNFGQTCFPQWSPPQAPRQRWIIEVARQVFALYKALMEQRDLPLLKKAGKGIFVTWQGDDARQGDYCRANFEITFANEVAPLTYYPPGTDERKRLRIRKFAQYADRMYALNPDLLYVLPKETEFLPYAHVFPNAWPVLLPNIDRSHIPVIVHAPSHRLVKGTRFVLEAVKRLREEGVDFSFILVENLTHSEAQRVYEQADLLIDQVLAGWYGGLAVELMAQGKPVISYIRESDMKFIPRSMHAELPIICASPESLYDVLRNWLTIYRHNLPDVGRQSRVFVEKWHDPVKIAARLKADYEMVMAGKTGRLSR